MAIPHLVRHFGATDRSDIIGLHSGSKGPDATAKWIAADIDQHGDGDTSEMNRQAAVYWFVKARALGFHPLLTDSNGKGGYHLRILFSASITLELAYKFGRWLFQDAPERGLPNLEIFPKQAKLSPPGETGQYGNWLRVPGRHHKRDYWSDVWDGERWLSGQGAVDCILATTGDDPALIPNDARNWEDGKSDPQPARPGTVFRLPGRITAYAAAALRSECLRVAHAPATTRNTTLNKAAFSLGRLIGSGELDRQLVEGALAEAARNAGLDESEIGPTLRSGLAAGVANPRGQTR